MPKGMVGEAAGARTVEVNDAFRQYEMQCRRLRALYLNRKDYASALEFARDLRSERRMTRASREEYERLRAKWGCPSPQVLRDWMVAA